MKMICSVCGINESIVSMTVLYNGKKSSVHLCSECIKNLGIIANDIDQLINQITELISKNVIKNFELYDENEENIEEEVLSFDNLLSIITGSKSVNSGPSSSDYLEGRSMKKKDTFCPYCGSSLEDILSSGHLGCFVCLEFFGNKVKHKPVKFEGRVPKVYRKIYIQDKLKDYLSRKMMAEIVRENFEGASKIKDIIGKMVK